MSAPDASHRPSRVDIRRSVTYGIALLIAAFLGFVGYHKVFSPLVELAKHGAWTIHLPETVGRLVGVSEIICAAALVAPMLSAQMKTARQIACLYLAINQVAAAATHVIHAETGALPQNFLLIALCLYMLWSSRSSALSSTGD